MASKGWVKLHRSITEHWVWDCEFSYAQAWVDLLVSANHSERKITIKGQLITIKRGQQARSEVTLSKLWKWSRNKVRRFLKNLESDGMITQKTTHLTSIITICNYNDFQGDDTTSGTGKGQQAKQAKDIRRNTNKNVNNEDNEDNENKKEQRIEDSFNKFYDSYHKKAAKSQALKAFKSAIKREGIKDIEEFSEMLITDCKQRVNAKQFGFDNLNASTYLNNNRWEDEKVQSSSQKGSDGSGSIAAEFGLYGWKG